VVFGPPPDSAEIRQASGRKTLELRFCCAIISASSNRLPPAEGLSQISIIGNSRQVRTAPGVNRDGPKMQSKEAVSETNLEVAAREMPRTSSSGESVATITGIGRIIAISHNAFRESVRDRVLYNLVLFALVLMGASVFVSQISIDEESKFIADLGLASMLVFGAVIAIFVGVGLVYKEIDKRTIYNMLSKPVHRHEFILGKFLGLTLTLLVNCVVMTAGTVLALLYVNKGATRLQLSSLPAAYLIFLELALLIAVALLFSSFTTPLLSALFSFAVYVIGHFNADLKLAASLSHSAFIRALLTVLYYLLPNLANFGYISEASRGEVVGVAILARATIYAIIYITVLLSATIVIFDRRNFK
jgi:Cu-processing system permease protein